MFEPTQLPGFATPFEANVLVNIYEQHKQHGSNKWSGFGDPILHYWDIHQFESDREYVVSIARRMQEAVERIFQAAPLYIEALFLTRLSPGGEHREHCDNSRPDGKGGYEPNHTPQRDFSSLLYLNGDFTGGDIVFPKSDPQPGGLAIHPDAGLLVAFPSTFEYPHRVPPVIAGKRYSMQVWYARDPAKNLLK